MPGSGLVYAVRQKEEAVGRKGAVYNADEERGIVSGFSVVLGLGGSDGSVADSVSPVGD
jgi:hypothetical protein